MKLKSSFQTAINNFLSEASSAVEDLDEKIEAQEAKDSPNEEKLDEYNSLKDTIELAISSVEEIPTE